MNPVSLQKIFFCFQHLFEGNQVIIFLELTYRTRVIITRGLYTFYPLFEVQSFFQGAFFLKFWPYVGLVFKSGL